MFLKQTLKRNQLLMETAFKFHQSGNILPDTYILDVDVFLENAKKILYKAQKNNIRLYFMLKQVGRNPFLAKKLVEMGYAGVVAVDYKEALIMMQNQIPIGNIGHLVQVPQACIKRVVAYRPELITVYSYDKIESIEKAAAELDLTQEIMIRVYGDNDLIYSGQTAGFHLDELPELINMIRKKCSHVRIKGVTSFPCYLYSEREETIISTENLKTVKKAAEILETYGCKELILNAPSTTCCFTLDKMKEDGVNCGEPGHGLSGTTPMHVRYDLDEIPSVVYVSEVSHNFQGKAYCFGGGYYRRSHMKYALVGKKLCNAKIFRITPPSPESIDYHLEFSEEAFVGDTVVMAFRFQIFVTRSDVVLIKGIQSGSAEIIGIYDSQGRKKELL